MREAKNAAPYVTAYLEGANRDAENPFAEHQLYCEKGLDVLEDTLDSFWEHPFTFAWLVHQKHREAMIDVFAGRIYEDQPAEAIQGFRRLLKRERTYDSEDIYSIPIGSRFHPERAPLWEERPPI